MINLEVISEQHLILFYCVINMDILCEMLIEAHNYIAWVHKIE
jgi:hypothetical protein